MTNYNCSAEADILNKYQDVFPSEFIEAVRKGVSWLCTHNNITYQTSIMVASDRVIYNTAGSSVLRIGLINVNLPLTGLTYYEVKSIEVAKDEVSGNIIFNVKMKYDTPMGLTVSLVPITYFDPESNKEYYTKAEINALLNGLQTSLDSKAEADVVENALSAIDARLETLDNTEALTKLENKVDDMLQSLALDFVTNEKLEEELAKLESGDKELDLTSYLKVKDAETTYLKIVDIATKPELKGPKGDKGETGEKGNQGEQGLPGANGKDGTSVTVDEVKPVILEALKTDEEFKESVKGEPGKDGASANKDEVIAALKADETFKAEVKGDKGDTGDTGPQGDPADVTNLATKEELTNLTTKVDAKAEKTDLDSKADKTELDAYVKTDALTDLVTTTRLTEEVAKLATTESLTNKLAEKVDTTTYTTDKATFVTNDSLTTTLGDYLKTSEADTKYQLKSE